MDTYASSQQVGSTPWLQTAGGRAGLRWAMRVARAGVIAAAVTCLVMWVLYVLTIVLALVPLIAIFSVMARAVAKAEQREIDEYGDATHWTHTVVAPMFLLALVAVPMMGTGYGLTLLILYTGLSALAGLLMAAAQLPRLEKAIGRRSGRTWVWANVVGMAAAMSAGVLVGPLVGSVAGTYLSTGGYRGWFPSNGDVAAFALGLFAAFAVGVFVLSALKGLALASLLNRPAEGASAAEGQRGGIPPLVAAGYGDISHRDRGEPKAMRFRRKARLAVDPGHAARRSNTPARLEERQARQA